MSEHRPPLRGITVVEVGGYVSGPFAGMMLADLGAEVVKVEPAEGDPYRKFDSPDGSISPFFLNVNRGKSTVVLDLKTSDGRQALLELLVDADVFVCNWRPGVAERLGLADHTLAGVNQRLIRLYVTGMGIDGPEVRKPTFDVAIQARSGLAWAAGNADDPPRLAADFVIDKLSATFASQAALAALFDRERTGLGGAVVVPMLDVASYYLFPDVFASRTLVDDQPKDARIGLLGGLRPVRAADGWFVVGAVSGAQLKATSRAFDRPEWIEILKSRSDPRSVSTRLVELLETVTHAMPVRECVQRLEDADVPAAQCLDPDEHLADQQVVFNGVHAIHDEPGVGRVRSVRHPARSQRWGELRSGPAPLLPRETDGLR
jgi:CoA:oxalate CoA-transferase